MGVGPAPTDGLGGGTDGLTPPAAHSVRALTDGLGGEKDLSAPLAPPQLTGLFFGIRRADQSPELVSEKNTRPLKGIALHVIGELGM